MWTLISILEPATYVYVIVLYTHLLSNSSVNQQIKNVNLLLNTVTMTKQI